MILSAVYSFFDSFQSFVLCHSDLYCHSDRLSFLFLLTSFSLPFHVSFFLFPLYFDALLSTSCLSFSFLFYCLSLFPSLYLFSLFIFLSFFICFFCSFFPSFTCIIHAQVIYVFYKWFRSISVFSLRPPAVQLSSMTK